MVIKPVGEILELSVKKNKALQRTMVNPQHEQASSAMDESGDLPSGEISEESMEVETGDLPSGKIPESQVAEPTEDLPTGERSVGEAKEEDVEMKEAKDEEVPQDEQAQQEQEEEPDFGEEEEYAESELSEHALLRVNELLNSEIYDFYGHEEDSDDEIQRVNPRPRAASRAQARFIHHMLAEDSVRLENTLAREREIREEFHRRTREEEQRREQANAAGNLPPGETPAVPGSPGHSSSGEIPDVPIEQETKEEQDVTQEKDEEVKIYQEELQGRKDIDIFAQSPTAQFMDLLKPETEEQATSAQRNFENLFVQEGVVKTNRPFQNKIAMQIDRPLGAEPKVKVDIPKPEPKGEDHSAEEYECALDGLKVLDKQYKMKTFRFYGKYFRGTHSNALNFVKFRKATSPIAHPCAKFDIDEKALVAVYCDLFFAKPAITYTPVKTIV